MALVLICMKTLLQQLKLKYLTSIQGKFKLKLYQWKYIIEVRHKEVVLQKMNSGILKKQLLGNMLQWILTGIQDMTELDLFREKIHGNIKRYEKVYRI